MKAIGDTNMVDHCLSALATAWVITFVVTTGLFASLAIDSVWDRAVFHQALLDVAITETAY